MELGQIDHQTGEQVLTRALRRLRQPAGQPQGDGGVPLVDFHRGTQSHHVVDGGFHQPHGAGHGGADDILALSRVTAVSLGIKTDDARFLCEECNGGHPALERDLADLDLGVRLTMALPFAIALLGGVLEDTDLLALAVLDDSGVHLRALHHGSAELGVLTIHDGQNLIENHGITSVDVQLLDEQSVTLADIVLLTASHDNSLHYLLHLPFLHYGLAVGGVRTRRNLKPIQSGLSSITADIPFVNRNTRCF